MTPWSWTLFDQVRSIKDSIICNARTNLWFKLGARLMLNATTYGFDRSIIEYIFVTAIARRVHIIKYLAESELDGSRPSNPLVIPHNLFANILCKKKKTSIQFKSRSQGFQKIKVEAYFERHASQMVTIMSAPHVSYRTGEMTGDLIEFNRRRCYAPVYAHVFQREERRNKIGAQRHWIALGCVKLNYSREKSVLCLFLSTHKKVNN